jgi:hypothetical protein
MTARTMILQEKHDSKENMTARTMILQEKHDSKENMPWAAIMVPFIGLEEGPRNSDLSQ